MIVHWWPNIQNNYVSCCGMAIRHLPPEDKVTGGQQAVTCTGKRKQLSL